jgi:cell wall assembly regulator SMI1
MKDVWQRIENWLEMNAPEVREGLNPPATPAQIAEAERALGVSFPPDLVEIFLIHDGQNRDTPGLLEGWEFLSLERIVDEWKVWKDLLDGGDFQGSQSKSEGHTVTDWWSPRWIPITYSGSGDHHSVDLNPGPLGQSGQIITMWHDDPFRPVLAPSFRAWLTKLVEDFEAGYYELNDKYGGIVECNG